MWQVLNMSEFWIFVNYRKCDGVLNLCWDAIIEKFLIIQDSEYARFLQMQTLDKVLNVPEYAWIMTYDRVLSMSGQRFTGFQISFRF